MISEILKEVGISKAKAALILAGILVAGIIIYAAGVYLIVKVAKYAWGEKEWIIKK